MAFLGDNSPDPGVRDALFESYGYPVGTVPQAFNQDVGFNADGTLFTTGNGEANSVANFRGVGDPQTSIPFSTRTTTLNSSHCRCR